jgi:pimeloyl-ACP methyl ester carboxylesterase
MTEVSVVAPDDGEAIQLGPIQMRILEDGKTTGHRLGVGEITIPAGTAGPPQHRHAQHDEGFYVVSGTARFTVGDTSYDAVPGTLVMEIPVLVLWGDSDRIVTPGYGQALAAAFPHAQFTVISQAGHLPQIEQPDATFGALDAFIRKNPGQPAA